MTDSAVDNRVNVWCLPLLRRLDTGPAGGLGAAGSPGGGRTEAPLDAEIERMLQWLSPEERAVATGFDSPERRRSYIAAHGLLRAILGQIAGVPPNELVFRYGQRGKPELAQPGLRDLQFNMSHAHDVMLLAVARGRRVGVDIEHIDAPGDVRRIAARFLSPRDRDAIEGLPAERQRAAFLRCWTRKEAYMKARGDGVSRPLDDFDVTEEAGEEALPGAVRSSLRLVGGPDENQPWHLADLPAPRGFMAAIAVEGQDLEVVQHDHWSVDG